MLREMAHSRRHFSWTVRRSKDPTQLVIHIESTKSHHRLLTPSKMLLSLLPRPQSTCMNRLHRPNAHRIEIPDPLRVRVIGKLLVNRLTAGRTEGNHIPRFGCSLPMRCSRRVLSRGMQNLPRERLMSQGDRRGGYGRSISMWEIADHHETA
jgi:hypothetical protein